MKKLKKLFFIIFIALLLIPASTFADDDTTLKLYIFRSSSCAHCAAEMEFLEQIKADYPTLEIVDYEVSENEMNYNFYLNVIEETGLNINGVPFTIIGTDYYYGYADSMEDEITGSIEKFIDGSSRDVISDIKNGIDVTDVVWNQKEDGEQNTDVSVLGKTIDAEDVSLPLLSIVLGAVDGFNPCAMWVLLFLITMLFNMKNKKKMWALGIIFLTTSALIYLLIMGAWLNIAVSFSSMIWLRMIIATIAILGGVLNLRSYIKSKKENTGCEVVSDNRRKRIMERIKKIALEKSFIISALGIMLLAISVNMIELGCSVGLPLVFTQVLAMNDVSTVGYIIYLLIYIFFFLLDDIIIFVIAMLTLNIKGISAKYGKYSHLIGGTLMFIIGLLLIFKPEWLMFNF